MVDAAAVTITAAQPAGLFYGVQTLRQLLPAFVEFEAARADPKREVRATAVRIVDHPRFAWRGAMLDVSRHFFDVDDVKRYIDLISLYKLNRLHLHLADDQGWRIEIKSWPNLTKIGGSTEVGGGPGGYYTQAQYSEIVAYARERFIEIIPEIDMPGHTNAALASYAELNCDGKARPPYTGIEVGFSALCVDKDVTYRFIDDVVREIAKLSPSPYFHIGGDEVKTLTPEQYTQFIDRVQKIVRSHGKQMIGWDEIAPATLEAGSIVQHWRPDGTPTAAVAKGAKVIMSVANRAYLDMKYDNGTPIGLNWAANIEVQRFLRVGSRGHCAGHTRERARRRRSADMVGDARQHAGRGVHGVPAAGGDRRDRVDSRATRRKWDELPRAPWRARAALDRARHQLLSRVIRSLEIGDAFSSCSSEVERSGLLTVGFDPLIEDPTPHQAPP